MAVPKTGIECIDGEHDWLFGIVSRLRDDPDVGDFHADAPHRDPARQDAALTEILADLLTYAVEHFAAEERLMRGLPRDESDAHKLEHDRITSRLAEIAAKGIGQAVLTSPAHLERIVRDWLEEHVVRFDLPLAARLSQRGG